ncbi:MAG: hypothetical protein ABSF90_20920 [Syntrophobacteraceae bacterium]|jgi:hypothetical protein
MVTLKKGSFSLNLGFIQLGGDLTDEDRQAAWELYAELSTRVAVTGKQGDPDCSNYDGELYIESLNSLYAFFQEARRIMRNFPVGKIDQSNKEHLGVLINRVIRDVLRPFLEKWHVKYRHWWDEHSNPRIEPMLRQSQFPQVNEFLEDWTSVRALMRDLQKELIKVYNLVDVGAEETVHCETGEPL